MDRSEFAKAFGGLCASFNREFSEMLGEAFWLGLQDLPYERFATGVMRCIQHCKQFPTVAEIREKSGELSIDARVALAWQKVDSAVCGVGAYHSVTFDDVTINAVIWRMGGWERLCETPAGEFDKWVKLEFQRLYRALLDSPLTPDDRKPLVGICQRQNRHSGQDYTPNIKRISTGLPVRTDLPAIEHRDFKSGRLALPQVKKV